MLLNRSRMCTGDKPGVCPEPGFGICIEECASDAGCPGIEKCCFNGCGHTCTVPEGCYRSLPLVLSEYYFKFLRLDCSYSENTISTVQNFGAPHCCQRFISGIEAVTWDKSSGVDKAVHSFCVESHVHLFHCPRINHNNTF